ncbi:MAG TPA: hypothetical protein VE955_02145 [Candidatus Dormibacteraeota bacterium]|nr:hypothetical protein [Candidatus Dormibacteraeota bacterium]
MSIQEATVPHSKTLKTHQADPEIAKRSSFLGELSTDRSDVYNDLMNRVRAITVVDARTRKPTPAGTY